MKRALSIWIFVIFCSSTLATQQYVFRAFREAEGLKNLSINGLVTDREGFLWVATENGVYRFLGSGFRRYGSEDGIAGVDIRDIVADPHGTVWIGTEEDLFRLDGERFVRVGSTPIPIVGPRRIALEDDRHLLVVDKGRLYRLEHDSEGRTISYVPAISPSLVSSHPDLEEIESFSVLRAPFRDGEVWAGSGKRLYSFSNRSDHSTSPASLRLISEWDQGKGLPADEWQHVVLDRRNTLWAAGLKHIVVMEPGKNSFIDRSIRGSDHQGIFGNAPLMEDPQGRMLANAGADIARWNGDRWQFIGRANGLTRLSAASAMAFDVSGDLFLAGRGGGLYYWAGYGDWEGWNSDQNLPSISIWAIAPGANRVYLGTENGPAWVDTLSGKSGRFAPVGKSGTGRISAMGESGDGTLWAVTYAGAFLRLHPQSNTVERLGTLGLHVPTGFQARSGRVFLFTSRGVYVREPGNPMAIPQRSFGADTVLGEPSMIHSVQSGCESPDGAVWLVGNNRIAKFNDGRWTAPPISGMSRLTGALLGLACAKDGSLWAVGDQTGVWRLTLEQGQLRAEQIVLPHEWGSLACLTVLQDRRGWLWVGTDLGFLVWNGREWRHVYEETGLIWNDTNQGVIREDHDGSLWIGTTGGLAHLLHPERIFSPMPISITLTRTRRGSQDFSQAKNIIMAEDGPPLEFQMSSPELRNRSELSLKLRMVGMNSDWVDTQDGVATFARLNPGSYTLMGMACNPGINACSPPISISINVRPPWWKTDWFSGFLAALMVIFFLICLRLYDRHLRQRSRELKLLVQERTRELEASREQLRIQATHDSLTGMLNREAIMNVLNEEIERAWRGRKPFVVALVDIDHFKQINDTHGHMTGDEALRIFAAAIKGALRPYDRCGRYGGEEFLIVLADLPTDSAAQRLESLHASSSDLPIGIGEHDFTITCSIGAVVVFWMPDRIRPETLLAIADEALYDAKASGRNRVAVRHFDRVTSSSDGSSICVEPRA